MDGYAGKYLNLNLSDGSGKDFVIPEEVVQRYLGGRGLGAWLLFQGLEPQVEPLSPDNVLVLSTGPLTGLGIPAMNHTTICTKSPLTGTITCASLGGDFASRLKSCGYDGIILRGRSPLPVIVDVTEGRWKIREAGRLWGSDVSRTQELLASQVAGTLCIGPAGENMVKFATIVSGEHTAERGGTGAVMGSKRVKAIRVGGNFETSVFDRERLERPVAHVKAKLKVGEAYPRYGTAGNVALANERGVLPTRNFTSGTFDRYMKITGDALRSQIRRKALDCPGCSVDCTNEIKLSTKAETMRVKGPGYQALVMLGSNLLIDELDAIVRNNYLCYLLGMDPISTGGTLAMAMELSEKGRMVLPLQFGSAREVGPLLPLIAQRKGPGDELADGAAGLVRRYGYSDLCMAVKGMELSGYDPRGCWGQGLAFATSPAGGTHNGSMMAAVEVLGRPVGIPGARAAGKVKLTIFSQDLFAALDTLVACNRAAFCMLTVPAIAHAMPTWINGFFAGRMPGFSSSLVDVSQYHAALSFVTGVKYNRRALLRVGERTFNLEHLFNLREGYTSKDDTLPLRFLGEPFREGPSAGNVVPLTKMLLRYYKARGWNEVGIPTEALLKRLTIDERSSG
ncbi:MAG: aldehyde ferredoxin oxidoreductase family protein [Actinobacteria bacterium]|nr:aldehyde ferredoxin oxidoreductase family protein [Actinomycetota bacterium]MBU1943696.1 aldehyde ferredoxin oxidoreductase family protein [Actinomycetota bacterium]MBU2686160.1 aldehyde ferredoxin oxidoreductase family protein [Actinomycetota bacterium]